MPSRAESTQHSQPPGSSKQTTGHGGARGEPAQRKQRLLTLRKHRPPRQLWREGHSHTLPLPPRASPITWHNQQETLKLVIGPGEKDEGHRQEAPQGQGCTKPLWSPETDHLSPHPGVSKAGPVSVCGGSVRVGPTRASRGGRSDLH